MTPTDIDWVKLDSMIRCREEISKNVDRLGHNLAELQRTIEIEEKFQDESYDQFRVLPDDKERRIDIMNKLKESRDTKTTEYVRWSERLNVVNNGISRINETIDLVAEAERNDRQE